MLSFYSRKHTCVFLPSLYVKVHVLSKNKTLDIVHKVVGRANTARKSKSGKLSRDVNEFPSHSVFLQNELDGDSDDGGVHKILRRNHTRKKVRKYE